MFANSNCSSNVDWSWTILHKYCCCTDELYTVACSPTDATLVATGGKDDKGFLWKIGRGDWAHELQGMYEHGKTAAWFMLAVVHIYSFPSNLLSRSVLKSLENGYSRGCVFRSVLLSHCIASCEHRVSFVCRSYGFCIWFGIQYWWPDACIWKLWWGDSNMGHFLWKPEMQTWWSWRGNWGKIMQLYWMVLILYSFVYWNWCWAMWFLSGSGGTLEGILCWLVRKILVFGCGMPIKEPILMSFQVTVIAWLVVILLQMVWHSPWSWLSNFISFLPDLAFFAGPLRKNNMYRFKWCNFEDMESKKWRKHSCC